MISLKNWKNNIKGFKEADVILPSYDVDKIKKAGKEHPVWLHIGAGNLYRTFQAEIADDLAEKGLLKSGIVVANMRSPFVINKIYKPYNNDILMITLLPDGSLKKRILASTADALFASPDYLLDWNKMIKYFEDPALQMVTYTITEKGYSLYNTKGQLSKEAKRDIENGPDFPLTAMGRTCALLLARFNVGAHPVAMVTTDNFSKNGDFFYDAVITIAKAWQENGYVNQDFIEYLSNNEKVSFPLTMIDRITPNPSNEVAGFLTKIGFDDVGRIQTPAGTWFSSFANTEQVKYLIIEDSFPNGRPKLEEAGVILCDKKTVELADTMKLTACLNPLQTCLAIFGCLFGYTRSWQEMKDKDLVKLITLMGFKEALPVLKDPKVINPKKFIEEFLSERLNNKNLADTPQRATKDISNKMSVIFGITLQSYAKQNDKNPKDLIYIPLAIAGWIRYLLGIDDEGKPFELSPDPMIPELKKYLVGIEIGRNNAEIIHNSLQPILSNKEIFSCDLYKIGLGDKIEQMFNQMISKNGSIRETINYYIS